MPLFGTAVCLLLMLTLPPVNWMRIGAWWAVGLGIYLVRRAAGGGAGRRVVESQDRARATAM
jgi:hypothetical protein